MSNNTDKRTVHTDALDTLGTTFQEGARDAIHLAVEPCIAGEALSPGQHIGFVDGKATSKAARLLGIVDPFIPGMVMEGEKFWMVLYPRTITSLRHVWEHPAFSDNQKQGKSIAQQEKEDAETWLRDWVKYNDVPDFDTVMAAVTGKPAPEIEDYGAAYRHDGEYITFYGKNAHCAIPPEFWEKVEVYLGKPVPQGDKAEYFSCSC